MGDLRNKADEPASYIISTMAQEAENVIARMASVRGWAHHECPLLAHSGHWANRGRMTAFYPKRT